MSLIRRWFPVITAQGEPVSVVDVGSTRTGVKGSVVVEVIVKVGSVVVVVKVGKSVASSRDAV